MPDPGGGRRAPAPGHASRALHYRPGRTARLRQNPARPAPQPADRPGRYNPAPFSPLPRGPNIAPLLTALRPHQWTKNLAVFVGILFARRLTDPGVLGPVGALFAAFCLLSSAVYLINDVRDREEDARHPVKCRRPIAAGRITTRQALATAALLAAAALTLVLLLPPAWPGRGRLLQPGPLALACYLTLNLAYSGRLKQVAIADVSCVALGFLIRVVSGPWVAGLEVSSWLILCTYFGALFLALGKRRGEQLATAGEVASRSVLSRYDPRVLDQLLTLAATATLLCYAIYTVAPDTVQKFGTRKLLYTVPIATYGLGRYFILIFRDGRGEDPASTLFRDRGLLAAIVAWLIASLAVLGLA